MSISIQRNLQKCMEDWKQISGLDFCLLSEDNSVFVATGERRIMATTLFLAVIMVGANLITDIVYKVIDPRIKLD